MLSLNGWQKAPKPYREVTNKREVSFPDSVSYTHRDVYKRQVSNQVSQIGQLKTIGMTEKQIKRMIRKEGYCFCLFGIPAGITVGIIFAYLLEPNGITIINAIATSILAIILGIIIVQISVYLSLIHILTKVQQ